MDSGDATVTWKQDLFLEYVKTGNIEKVIEMLIEGSEELLCVIGRACALSLHDNRKIFDLLANEKSRYKILRTFHTTPTLSNFEAEIAPFI